MTSNKVAVITGGASGIGLAVGAELVKKGGWSVHLLDVNEEAGKAACKPLEPTATFHKTDVTDWEQLSRTFYQIFEKEKRFDFVFGNAGSIERFDFYHKHPADQIPPPPDTSVVDVNLKSVYMTSYLALHYFRHSPADDKSLVLNASSGALYGGPGAAMYVGSKHGVLGFMRSIARQMIKEGIRVNALCLGPVRTGLLTEGMWDALFTPEDFSSMSFVTDAVFQLVRGDAMADVNGKHIAAGKVNGLAVETSVNRMYFREQVEFCDKEMAKTMGADITGDK